MNKDQYEKNLKEKQMEHLRRVSGNKETNWTPCMHDSCTECHGTGVKLNGSPCFHFISCNCSKCAITI